MGKHMPADSFASPRFCGVRTFMRLPHVTDLEGVDFAVCGVPFDTGASFRVGARFGPEAVRSASVLLRPYNPVLEINIFDHLSGIDYGDLPVVPGYIEPSYRSIEAGVRKLVQAGVVPVLLGGDHSVTLPELRAVAALWGPVALVHFDSHADTWDRYFDQPYTHGTPFRRAAEEGLVRPERSIQVGMRGSLYAPDDLEESRRLGYMLVTTREAREMGTAALIAAIKERVGDAPAFLTFDIDFLDPAYAPGTGTPEAGGFTTFEAQEILRGLTGLNFVGYDLVEVLPSFDHGAITALAAANIVYEFISLLAVRRRDRGGCRG